MRERPQRDEQKRLVIAARDGDRAAADELIRAHLPLVYNLVRRALNGRPDVDDVVQETMVRALRQLPGLRRPESFRSWLTAIALNQISSHLAEADAAAARTTGLDAVAGLPDAGAALEGPALLQAELSRQRRQVLHAGRWLDPEERTLLPLWWLEIAGQITRRDMAAALGVTVPHAGVRIQRMRRHLEQSRAIVGALEAVPGCGRLDAVIAEWDGMPSPFWRKRIARHVEDCPVCAGAAHGWVATDRLLAGLALLPVPAVLATGVLGKAAATTLSAATAWSLGGIVPAVAAHPIGAAVAAATLAVGVTVTTTALTPGPPPGRPAIAAQPPLVRPSPPRTATTPPSTGVPLRLGRVSLEAGDSAGRFVAVAGDLGVLRAAGPADDTATRQRATFEAVPGLADSACFSFRARDGRYLRHSSWRVRLSGTEGTVLFRRDATFCARGGTAAGRVTLESANYPGWFLRHVGDELWVDQSDGSAAFRADSTFVVRRPLA